MDRSDGIPGERGRAAPPRRRALGPSRGGRLAPWGVGALLAVLAYSPALIEWDASGWGDWQHFHHTWEVGRIAITRFGELPLFDPHHCGGVSMWGQPQSQHLAPTWWVTGLAFGTVAGHKLFILLHHVVGFVGMLAVARRIYHLSVPASALAALAWAFSGFFAWRGAGGHSTFLAFHYLPFIFYCWRKSHEDLRYAGGVGALMGLVLMEGGTYPFPLTVLVIAFDFLADLARGRFVVIRTGLVTGALTLLCGAIRLWPIYDTMSRFPRETRMEDAQSFAHLLESLTARDPHPWVWGHRWVWAEYGSFVGWGVIVLAAGGALVALRSSRRWHLILGAALFAACAMGNHGPEWPWPMLHELPVFKNFHVPSRFHVLLTFYLALLAAVALDAALRPMMSALMRPRAQRALLAVVWILIGAIGLDILTNDIRIAARWDGPPISGEPAPRFHLVGPQHYLETYAQYPQRNVGTAACYDPVPWDISRALWIGDVPQVRLDPPTAGEVGAFTRTNHTFVAEVTLRQPARVIVNQNFDPSWRLSVGEPIEDRLRLAVDLGAGTHRIEGRFAPPDLPWSVLATLLGLGLGIALLFASPRRIARLRGTPAPTGLAVERRER